MIQSTDNNEKNDSEKEILPLKRETRNHKNPIKSPAYRDLFSVSKVRKTSDLIPKHADVLSTRSEEFVKTHPKMVIP